MASQLQLQQKVAALNSKIIDPSKCVPRTSLCHQILRRPQKVLKEQNKKFNMGNGQFFNDPIKAADQLMAREYADTALFDTNRHAPIFIPSVFQSKQYAKKDSSVHLLDYDVDIKSLKRYLDNLIINSPTHWFIRELQAFYDLQQNGYGDEINAKEFANWILNVKIVHLLMIWIDQQVTESSFGFLCCVRHQDSNDLTLPLTTVENNTFIKACIQEVNTRSPGSQLEQILKKVSDLLYPKRDLA